MDENLQLTIYALACRDALDLGTPERVTLYFPESATRLSTTRTDEQLDAARAEILARVRPIRAGEFTAKPRPGLRVVRLSGDVPGEGVRRKVRGCPLMPIAIYWTCLRKPRDADPRRRIDYRDRIA